MATVAKDLFTDSKSASAPAEHMAVVSPSDTNELTYVTRGISFAVAGTIAVVTVAGESVTITSGSLAAGIIHPLRVKQILSTNTTATGIMAYW